MALAILANLEQWDGYYGRVARALTRYDLPKQAVEFFRVYGGPPAPVVAGLPLRGSAGGGAGGPDPAWPR